MATILLVTATYIKDYTPIDPNVDEKYIRIAIEEAQKIHIREYIGSGLYDEIIGQVNNNTISALNTTLLDNYIIPALKWWAVVEVIPFLVYKILRFIIFFTGIPSFLLRNGGFFVQK